MDEKMSNSEGKMNCKEVTGSKMKTNRSTKAKEGANVRQAEEAVGANDASEQKVDDIRVVDLTDENILKKEHVEKRKRTKGRAKIAKQEAEQKVDQEAKQKAEQKEKILECRGQKNILEEGLAKEPSLSECMLRLLQSPANGCEEAEKLLKSGFCAEEINQTMLLAQAMLMKAVEKGDVSAYREVKALIDMENDGNGQFERLLGGIREAVLFEQGEQKEKGPD